MVTNGNDSGAPTHFMPSSNVNHDTYSGNEARISQSQHDSFQYSQQPLHQMQQQQPTEQSNYDHARIAQHHSHHHGGSAFSSNALCQSVVPDLIKVYERLTQSSTPHHPVPAHHTVNDQQLALAQPQQSTQQNQGTPLAADGIAPSRSPQHAEYEYYQQVAAPGSDEYAAPNTGTQPQVTGDSHMHYYVHSQNESHPQQVAGSHYQPPPQQQEVHDYQAPQPQSHQHPHHHYAPPTEELNATRQPHPGYPNPRVEGKNHAGHHPILPTQYPAHQSQHVQVVTQHNFPGPQIHGHPSHSPPPPPRASPQPPAVAASLATKRDSYGSDDGSASSRRRPRKKGGSSDGRWSKRFQWPDELHRDFVSAVFDVGLKHSSPSAILEHMTPNEMVTSERVKSHLQKYRLHRQRSKRSFMNSYDAALEKLKSTPSEVLIDQEEVRALSSGEVAAHLSCATMSEENSTSAQENGSKITPSSTHACVTNSAAAVGGGSAVDRGPKAACSQTQGTTQRSYGGGALYFPQLTEEEKRSPIGASMGYLMGLFFSLDQQLASQRASAKSATAPSSVQGMPSSGSCTAQNDNPSSHYVHLIAPPVHGPLVPAAQAPAPMPSPQAAFVIGPSPGQTQYFSDAPASPSLMQPQGHAASDNANPLHAPLSTLRPVGLRPAFQPPPASARHPTQPQMPLHSHSASIIEENDMMKRDMRSQMALQNKMRALKEQEKSKYQTSADTQAASAGSKDGNKSVAAESAKEESANSISHHKKAGEEAYPAEQSQLVGESSNGEDSNVERSSDTALPGDASAGHDPLEERNSSGSDAKSPWEKASSPAPAGDFWNSDVVDEQLFEFLMS